MGVDERLRGADPGRQGVTRELEISARALARAVADDRGARRGHRVPVAIIGVLAALGIAGSAAAVATPDLMPWARPYLGDLHYERVIPLETGDLLCQITLGAEPDPLTADATTEQRFDEATEFLASISIDVMDATTAESESTWAQARAREYAKPDPDEAYINSTFVGQIEEEFVARGFLGNGIAFQAEYGCGAQK